MTAIAQPNNDMGIKIGLALAAIVGLYLWFNKAPANSSGPMLVGPSESLLESENANNLAYATANLQVRQSIASTAVQYLTGVQQSQAAIATAQIQGQTAQVLGADQVQANEDTVAGQEAIASTQAGANVQISADQTAAASSIAQQEAKSAVAISNNQTSASKTASNDSLWGSIIGTIGNVAKLFSFNAPASGAQPTLTTPTITDPYAGFV